MEDLERDRNEKVPIKKVLVGCGYSSREEDMTYGRHEKEVIDIGSIKRKFKN